jgi:hypothetical protein
VDLRKLKLSSAYWPLRIILQKRPSQVYFETASFSVS